jgi:hypothetical protein
LPSDGEEEDDELSDDEDEESEEDEFDELLSFALFSRLRFFVP